LRERKQQRDSWREGETVRALNGQKMKVEGEGEEERKRERER
jgi:hypothetical protein